MNIQSLRYLLWHFVLLATIHSQLSNCLAQGTAFVYQGRLNDGGNPAAGNYDLRFTIYDSTNNPGVIIAGPLTNTALDADGVALAAIQGLNQKVEAQRAELKQKQTEIAELKQSVRELQELVQAMNHKLNGGAQ